MTQRVASARAIHGGPGRLKHEQRQRPVSRNSAQSLAFGIANTPTSATSIAASSTKLKAPLRSLLNRYRRTWNERRCRRAGTERQTNPLENQQGRQDWGELRRNKALKLNPQVEERDSRLSLVFHQHRQRNTITINPIGQTSRIRQNSRNSLADCQARRAPVHVHSNPGESSSFHA